MYSIETGGDGLGYSLEMKDEGAVLDREYFFWAFIGDGIQLYKRDGTPEHTELFYQQHLQPEDAEMLLKKFVRHQANAWQGDLDSQGIESRLIDTLDFP